MLPCENIFFTPRQTLMMKMRRGVAKRANVSFFFFYTISINFEQTPQRLAHSRLTFRNYEPLHAITVWTDVVRLMARTMCHSGRPGCFLVGSLSLRSGWVMCLGPEKKFDPLTPSFSTLHKVRLRAIRVRVPHQQPPPFPSALIWFGPAILKWHVPKLAIILCVPATQGDATKLYMR